MSLWLYEDDYKAGVTSMASVLRWLGYSVAKGDERVLFFAQYVGRISAQVYQPRPLASRVVRVIQVTVNTSCIES